MQKKTAKKPSDIGACDGCGRLIVLSRFTLCYDCRHKQKEDVDKALDYLKDHRGATLQQVAEATGVDSQLVLRLIRGGRMEVMAQDRVTKKNPK